jgi:lysozyme
MPTVSARGRAFLKAHEGEVLKAYRCPAGIWTIGVGLTKASGVVSPKAGMVISRDESDRLLSSALDRNYAPRVARAMPTAAGHEFDGGVSFDFNTGAIDRASWVKAWRARNKAKVRSGLMAWVKGGGRVLPGLQRRRAEEADMILHDRWPADLKVASEPATPTVAFAVFVISMTADEKEAVRKAFAELGYDAGNTAGRVRYEAAIAFQQKFALTIDGKIGKATLSTLERELVSRRLAKGGGATLVGGGTAAGAGEAIRPAETPVTAIDDAVLTLIGFAALAAGALYLAYVAWHYRDLIAARVSSPRLAAWLRSF